MIRFRLLILSWVISATSLNAQSYLEITDNDSTETNEERLELMVEFMTTLNFDTVADIGSGNLEFILKIADNFSDKIFVLEDIDSSLCNRTNMLAKISEYKLSKIDTNNLSICIGEIKSTLLPSDQFDLIILSGLIHEINFKDEFFADIKRILKQSGSIIISDAFYEYPPGLHHGCTNRFLTNQEMEQLINQQNLLVLKDWRRIGIKTNSNGLYVSRVIQCSLN